MNPDDAFEHCLELLHRAALDDASWSAASAAIDESCGAVGNALVVGERSGDIHFIQPLYRGEANWEVAREYFGNYYPHDQQMRRRMASPDGRLLHITELYTETELKTSVAYNEGQRLMRAQDGFNVCFEEPDGLRTFWAVGDPVGSGGWQSDQVGLIERLLPHVRQFVRVRQALAAADALGAGLPGLLDNDRIGVVQLDRAGRVLEANGPALEILRAATDCPTATAPCRPRCRRIAAACSGCWGARCRICGAARRRAAAR